MSSPLAQIRDAKLYRHSHKTFADYVKERWGRKRTWAQQLIDASGVVESVRNCEHQPANEAQARELAKLPEGKRSKVWEAAVKEHGDKPWGTWGTFRGYPLGYASTQLSAFTQ